MKNNILLIAILYIIFIIGTIIICFLSYMNIKCNIPMPFIIGYLVLTLFLVIYTFIMTILNLRKLRWVEIRKRIFKFIILFVSFGILNVIFDYFFRHSNIDLFKEFSTSLGLIFALSFVDITFLKKKENIKEDKNILKFKKIK